MAIAEVAPLSSKLFEQIVLLLLEALVLLDILKVLAYATKIF
jgi:hypothetical protein